MLKRSVLAVAVLAIAACSPGAKAPDPKATAALKAELDGLTTAVLKDSPEAATSLAVSDEMAGGPYADRLSDYSTEAMAARTKIASDTLARLEAIDATKLSKADALSRDVVAAALRNYAAGAQFGYGTYGFNPVQPYVVSQIDGAYATIPDFLDSQHKIENVKDAENYIARLKAFAVVMDQESARIAADADKGVIPPDFVIDGALKQLKAFAAKKPADTILVQSLKRRSAAIEGVDPAQAADLAARGEAVVKDEVLPAYKRQIAALEAIRPKATHDAGVWKQPKGDELYAAALRAWTTTDLTPDQIHEMGNHLVENLVFQMDFILDQQGMTQGGIAKRLEMASALKKNDFIYPNTEAGKEQLLADLNGKIDALQPLLPKYFGVLPKAKLEIKRVPPYIEAGAPGGYYQSPAPDGSRPGAYYINLRNTSEWPRYMLPTLTYHEGEPGHHLQIAIAQESTGLPYIRSKLLGFSGYQEGWGLYAEQLADEMGVYDNDPWGRLGYLQSMTFRAARLVVDTGMHAKHWTREEAIDYMADVTGQPRSSVETEVERYAVWPGQAASYMLGRETINRLREEAKKEMGDTFDIKAFHDLILTNGAMPLSVLETVVRAWIEENKPPEKKKGLE